MSTPISTNSPPSSRTSDEAFGFRGADAVLQAWQEGMRPDPRLTVSQWADQHRMLSSRASAEPGRYRTNRTPYMRDIMDALSPTSPVQRVVFMKAAQVGATEAGCCFIGFVIHHAPGPMLCVQPTVKMAIGTLLSIETCMAAFNTVATVSGDPPYIAVKVARQLSPSGLPGATYAVERSYDGSSHYPRKACGSIVFIPPENIDYAGERIMVAAQRDALMAVLPEIQALARQIVQANHPNPALRQPLPSTGAGSRIPERAPSIAQVYEEARYMDDWGAGFAAIGRAMADQQGRANPDSLALTRAAVMLLDYAAHGVNAKAEPQVSFAFQVAFDTARAAQGPESRRQTRELAAQARPTTRAGCRVR